MTAYHLEDDKRRGGGCADKKLKLNSTHESIATFMTDHCITLKWFAPLALKRVT